MKLLQNPIFSDLGEQTKLLAILSDMPLFQEETPIYTEIILPEAFNTFRKTWKIDTPLVRNNKYLSDFFKSMNFINY